jgi:hypothetical protein
MKVIAVSILFGCMMVTGFATSGRNALAQQPQNNAAGGPGGNAFP